MYHSRRSSTSCSLAKSGSMQRQRQTVEGEIPGRVPGVLPGVRHRDDVGVVEVAPVGVAAVLARGRRRRLRPDRRRASARRRSGRTACSRAGRRRPGAGRSRASSSSPAAERCVERVGLDAARGDDRRGVGEGIGGRRADARGTEAEQDRLGGARPERDGVVGAMPSCRRPSG